MGFFPVPPGRSRRAVTSETFMPGLLTKALDDRSADLRGRLIQKPKWLTWRGFGAMAIGPRVSR